MGVVGFPRLAALDRDAAEIHIRSLAGLAGNSNRYKYDYGTTFSAPSTAAMDFNRLLLVANRKATLYHGARAKIG
jgi:hypothetical protein